MTKRRTGVRVAQKLNLEPRGAQKRSVLSLVWSPGVGAFDQGDRGDPKSHTEDPAAGAPAAVVGWGRPFGAHTLEWDDGLSSDHFTYRRVARDLFITNGQPRHATTVNGDELEHGEDRKLALGDVIRAGDTFFVVHTPAPRPRPEERRPPLSDMVGFGAATSALRAQLARLATSIRRRREPGQDTRPVLTVLVEGATGTGKELVARALHEMTTAGRAKLVQRNCGAIPATLKESELFGSVEGGFSGAKERESVFEQAQDGTLFLDEVGELTLDVQPALLRAVDFGEIKRMGDERVRRVRLLLVSATLQDLTARVESGEFREDLYQRIAQNRVVLAPLSARREDIPLLVGHFLAEDPRAKTFLPDDLERLLIAPWPRNVRELRDVVCRAWDESVDLEVVRLTADDAESLDARIDAPLPPPDPADADPPPSPPPRPELDIGDPEAVAAFIRDEHGGNRTRAAAALGYQANFFTRVVKREFDMTFAEFRAAYDIPDPRGT